MKTILWFVPFSTTIITSDTTLPGSKSPFIPPIIIMIIIIIVNILIIIIMVAFLFPILFKFYDDVNAEHSWVRSEETASHDSWSMSRVRRAWIVLSDGEEFTMLANNKGALWVFGIFVLSPIRSNWAKRDSNSSI